MSIRLIRPDADHAKLASNEFRRDCNHFGSILDTAAMAELKNPVLMAVIGAAHGIKGELRVKAFTGDPLALEGYGPLVAKDGRRFEILDIRPQGTVVVVRFKGVGDRSAAEALTGTELFVERAALSAALDDEEFYHADLVGLSVVDEHGAGIGKVAAVLNFGAGDILELAGPGLNGALVPFTKAAVPVVDLAARTLQLDSIAAGLANDADNDSQADTSVDRTGGFDPKRRPRGPRDAGGNR
jgi:16S rRNA processing protein RimM